MGRIGFWQLLLDDRVSPWEKQRIYSEEELADLREVNASDKQRSAYTLANRVDTMSREIVMLRTALTVLTQHLKESKIVDEEALERRLDAAIARVAPKPPPPMPELVPVTVTISCIRCRQKVDASTTFMTADGPVCERPCS